MPKLSSLELYAAVVRPRLAAGPMALEELNVTPTVMQRLEAAGLVRSRAFKLGALATRVWCLPEDYDAVCSFQPPSTPTKPQSCEDLTEADWPPDSDSPLP